MNHNKKKISYHARIGSKSSIGVLNKIKDIVDAFNHNDNPAALVITQGDGVESHFRFCKDILSSNADIIIIRVTAFSMLLLVPIILLKRLIGTRVILEIPTPPSIIFYEMNSISGNKLKKILLKSAIITSFPASLWAANKIVASVPEESTYFNLFLKKKTTIVGNGINTAKIKYRSKSTENNREIVLLSISSLENWHGIDRIIQGMAQYNNMQNVKLYIVGDGRERSYLSNLVEELNLGEHIIFTGNLQGESLDDICMKATAAFSSLGLHRKNLQVTAELKNREYLARNLPIIMSEIPDIDIPGNLEFVHQIPANDEPVDISAVLDFIARNQSINPRKFAEEVLDYRSKVRLYI